MAQKEKAIMITLVLVMMLSMVAEGCKDPNCINCLKDPTVCTSCRKGFRLTDKHCDPCDDPNCTQCNES
jgi:hypothetical protein